MTVQTDAGADLWVGDTRRGAVSRLSADGPSVSPAWRPNGLEIAFAYSKAGPFNLSRLGAGAVVEPGTCVTGDIPEREVWSGSPAQCVGIADGSWPAPVRRRSLFWTAVYTVALFGFGWIPLLAGLPWLLMLGWTVRHDTTLEAVVRHALMVAPVGVLTSVVVYATLLALAVRVLSLSLKPGFYKVDSRVGWSAWLVESMVDGARATLFPLYAGLITPFWLRRLGATIGKRVEASTVTGLPRLMRAADGSFLADDAQLAPYEAGGGWVLLGEASVGERSFVGNSGIVGPGRSVPDHSLVAVLSSAPSRAEAGSSWLGRPAMELPRVAETGDLARTFAPPRRLVVARAFVESLRVLPWIVMAVLGVGVLTAFEIIRTVWGWGAAAAVAGLIMLAAGLVAALVTTLAKWLLVGRFKESQHPLWSAFVWRNELFDVFYEELGVPWFGGPFLGTPIFNAWVRTLGGKIGKGVWLESYWLPETDLVRLEDGATVNRGCVLQTHLFHDRLLRISSVHLGRGATLGPRSFVLPGTSIGAGARIGPGSLVMRGESVPGGTRWAGNPITAVEADDDSGGRGGRGRPPAPGRAPAPHRRSAGCGGTLTSRDGLPGGSGKTVVSPGRSRVASPAGRSPRAGGTPTPSGTRVAPGRLSAATPARTAARRRPARGTPSSRRSRRAESS